MIKKLLLLFFIVQIIFWLGHLLGEWILLPLQVHRHGHGKHHCNHCKVSFFNTSTERKYFKFCPFCGRPTQYYYLDKRYEEEIAIERENHLEEEKGEE